MKKFWIQISIFGIALSILAAYYVFLRMQWIENEVLYRAQIARMLSLIKYEPDACEKRLESAENMELPADVSKDSWYRKYVSIVMDEGWMKPSEDHLFHPGDVFSYGDLKEIMQSFYITEEPLSFSAKYREDDGMVQKKQWHEIFDLIVVNEQRVQKHTYFIYDTSGTSSNLGPWQVKTDQGIKNAEGLVMDKYIGQCVRVYTVGDHILDVIDVVEGNMNQPESNNEPERIRVILHENEGGYEHQSVSLTSDQIFYVMNDDSVWKYDPGIPVEFDKDDSIFDKGEVRIKTENSDGKLNILSLERSCGTPSYDGEIILQRGKEKIIIINEVNLESYVAGVLPGEMPVTYDAEALKAQAVCIRTYAKRCLGSQFRDYPAHVDDTVSTQVYNNQLACKESIQAAMETEGIVLKNQEGYTPTYFFSTSCGHTSSAEDIWFDETNNEIKGTRTVFLAKEPMNFNLADENQFREFIDLVNYVDYFEYDLPWFRWQVFISDETIEKEIQEQTGTDIGNLCDVQILERAQSGVIKSLLIEGDEGEETIYGEFSIREIFSPEGVELRSHTGTVVTDWKLLPSGYFYMDMLLESDQCEGYLIHGGGYGHGCGMSQNGAMKMAEMGKSYDEILAYFFSDSNIVKE